MKLATELCGIELEHPLMNAAGTCKTIEQFERMVRSAVSAVMVGSITMEPRTGNTAPVYHSGGPYSINSLGLPNPGREYYRRHLPEMRLLAEEADKPLFVSVAGFSPEEYADLAELAYEGGALFVELNLGCPNVWGDDGQKPIASFYPEMVDAILQAVYNRLGQTRFGAKLSPLSNPARLKEVAEALKLFSSVIFVTTSNTFPNALDLDADGNPVISVRYGGMAGLSLKPIALGQVSQLRELLPDEIQVIGAGGVRVSADILDYRNAGADAVQAATAYWDAGENPGVYGDILADADKYFEIEQTA